MMINQELIQVMSLTMVLAYVVYRVIQVILDWRNTMKMLRETGIPMAKLNFPLGQLCELVAHRHNNEHLKAKWSQKFGRVFIIFVGPVPVLHCADPELIEDMLIHEEDFGPSPKIQFALTQVFGLPVIPGMTCPKAHRDARKAIAPLFSPMQINRAIATAQVETLALVREWNDDCDQAGESPKEKDLAQDLRHLTCTSFASFLFGMSSARAQVFAKERVVELVQTLMEHIAVYLAMGILPLGKIVFPVMLRSKFEEIRHKKERLHAIIRDQIQMAETVLPARHERVVRPILSHLEQSPESKKSVVASLLLSVESITTLMACSLIELVKHPEWQTRLRAEMQHTKLRHAREESTSSLLVDSEGNFRPEILRRELDEMTWFLYEVLRTYVLVPGNLRMVSHARPVLGGKYALPRGLTIRMMAKPMTVDVDLWTEDPLTFNPLRFQHGLRSATTHRCAFIPFGLGKRSCMGRNVALYQTKAKLAILLERFSFEGVEGVDLSSEIECLALPNVMKKCRFKLQRIS